MSLAKDNINLPNMNWFCQKNGNRYITNIFTGSLGTDSISGCINKTVFNFKILPKISEAGNKFVFESFYRLPFSEGLSKTEEETKEFEFSEKGLEEILEYIYLKAEKL